MGPFMKRAEVLLLIGVLTLLRAEARAAIGYVNVAFEPGDNWFGNPLQYTNQLDLLIPTAPDGSTVSLWDSTADHFDSTATFGHGTWSTNLTLNPGTGALLHTPSLFTNTFVGIVLNFDGSPYSGSLTEPPPGYQTPSPDQPYAVTPPAPQPAKPQDAAVGNVGL